MPKPVAVNRALLRAWQIVTPSPDDSKEDRGRVLIVGGEHELPGAVLLAGIAALRSGAGKLQIATCKSAAVPMGVAIPEARVVGLDETGTGTIRGDSAAAITGLLQQSHAALIGPGMTDAKECAALLARLLPEARQCTIVLDAGALNALGDDASLLPASGATGVITPHAGEMAALLGVDIEQVTRDPAGVAAEVARSLGIVVVLKGPETHIISPDGDHFMYESGDVGLATSGSGDVLAGILAGLAARGADPLQASVWAVYLHGEAGNVIARKSGRVGYLARELCDEIPPLLNSLSATA